MLQPFFMYIKGDLVSAADFLMDEGLAFTYSARKKQIRVMIRRIYRMNMVTRALSKLGCKIRIENAN